MRGVDDFLLNHLKFISSTALTLLKFFSTLSFLIEITMEKETLLTEAFSKPEVKPLSRTLD